VTLYPLLIGAATELESNPRPELTPLIIAAGRPVRRAAFVWPPRRVGLRVVRWPRQVGIEVAPRGRAAAVS
jgi:hypothetical protein